MKYVSLIFLFLFNYSHAEEFGCQLKPYEIGTTATGFLKDAKNKGESMPNNIDAQPVVDAHFSNRQQTGATEQYFGTLEGFIRPESDGFFPILPIPILGIAVERDHDLVYYCAHYDSDPSKTHITFYALRGGLLDKEEGGFFSTISNAISQFGESEEVHISPISVSTFRVGDVSKRILSIFNWIPFLNLAPDLANRIQDTIFNLFGTISGLSVERVVVTSEYVDLDSGINLTKPQIAIHHRRLYFNPPEDHVKPKDVKSP